MTQRSCRFAGHQRLQEVVARETGKNLGALTGVLVLPTRPLPNAERRALPGPQLPARARGLRKAPGGAIAPQQPPPSPRKGYYRKNVPTLTRHDELRAATHSAPGRLSPGHPPTGDTRSRARRRWTSFRPSPSISPAAPVPPGTIPPLFSFSGTILHWAIFFPSLGVNPAAPLSHPLPDNFPFHFVTPQPPPSPDTALYFTSEMTSKNL